MTAERKPQQRRYQITVEVVDDGCMGYWKRKELLASINSRFDTKPGVLTFGQIRVERLPAGKRKVWSKTRLEARNGQ